MTVARRAAIFAEFTRATRKKKLLSENVGRGRPRRTREKFSFCAHSRNSGRRAPAAMRGQYERRRGPEPSSLPVRLVLSHSRSHGHPSHPAAATAVPPAPTAPAATRRSPRRSTSPVAQLLTGPAADDRASRRRPSPRRRGRVADHRVAINFRGQSRRRARRSRESDAAIASPDRTRGQNLPDRAASHSRRRR